MESSKVSFVKKKLKEEGVYELSKKSYHDTEIYSNDGILSFKKNIFHKILIFSFIRK